MTPALRRLLLGTKNKIHSRCLSTNTPTTHLDADEIIANLHKDNKKSENSLKLNRESPSTTSSANNADDDDSSTHSTSAAQSSVQLMYHNDTNNHTRITSKVATPILDVGKALQTPAGCLASDDDESSYIPYVRIAFVL